MRGGARRDEHADVAVGPIPPKKQPEMRRIKDVVPGGVAAFPETLMRLFRGENNGKLVLKVADA
ncbi:hypothetical protein [Streptomyces sp. NPDC005209]|uniref:hypothetical protein n=1 Tax=Streptomyces sp. NPDC005209 TaxID=3156715 RepID=UPI00339E86D6